MLVTLTSKTKRVAEEVLQSHDALAAKYSRIILYAADSASVEEVRERTGWSASVVRHILEKYKTEGDSLLLPRPKTKAPLFKNWLFTTFEGAEWTYYNGALLISSLANSQIVMEEIKHLIPEPAGKRVLDVGAGEGAQAMMLRDIGFSVQCIDVEDSRYVPLDIPFLRMDADKGLVNALGSEQYDLVMAIEVLGYFQEPCN